MKRIEASLDAWAKDEKEAGVGKPVATRTQIALDRVARGKTRAAPIMGEMLVVVDTREQAPWALPLSIACVVRKLDTGDYSVAGLESGPNGVSLDRKSADDFAGVLFRERDRFDRELERMSAMAFGAILVESSYGDIMRHSYRSEVAPATVLSCAAAITVRHKIPVYFLNGPAQAADFGIRLLRMAWRAEQRRIQAAGLAQVNAALGEVPVRFP